MPDPMYAKQIATFLGECQSGAVGDNVIRAAMSSFRDTIGVALAGQLDESTRVAAEATVMAMGRGDGTVLGSDLRLPPAGAAMVNGIAAHALDFDDVSMVSGAHASAAIVPAALAAAEVVGGSLGATVTAYVAGYEVLNALASGVGKSSFYRGWHGTGIFGPIGATVAVSYLLGLNDVQIANALAIAASSAGAVYRNIGTMVKPYHAGRAAMTGILSGFLALEGLDGAPDALEGPLGFAKAFGQLDAPGPLPPLGRPFTIVDPGVGIKIYPIGSPLMGAVEGALHLLSMHNFSPADVKRIRIGASQKTRTIARFERAESVHARRYSLPYAVAAAVCAGRLTQDEFSSEFAEQPDVRALAERIHVTGEEAFADVEGWPPPTRVVIETEDGRRFEVVWDKARGMRSGGYLTEEELQEKYMSCASPALGMERALHSLALFDLSNLEMSTQEFLRRLAR